MLGLGASKDGLVERARLEEAQEGRGGRSSTWAWGGQHPDIVELAWGASVVPAAAIAFADEALYLAVQASGPVGRGDAPEDASVGVQRDFPVPLIDDEFEPAGASAILRIVELGGHMWEHVRRRGAVGAPFSGGTRRGWPDPDVLARALETTLRDQGLGSRIDSLMPEAPRSAAAPARIAMMTATKDLGAQQTRLLVASVGRHCSPRLPPLG